MHFKNNTLYAGIWEPNPSGVEYNNTLEFAELDKGSQFQSYFDARTSAPHNERLGFVRVTGLPAGVNKILSGHHYFAVFMQTPLGPGWPTTAWRVTSTIRKWKTYMKEQGFMPILVQATPSQQCPLRSNLREEYPVSTDVWIGSYRNIYRFQYEEKSTRQTAGLTSWRRQALVRVDPWLPHTALDHTPVSRFNRRYTPC